MFKRFHANRAWKCHSSLYGTNSVLCNNDLLFFSFLASFQQGVMQKCVQGTNSVPCKTVLYLYKKIVYCNGEKMVVVKIIPFYHDVKIARP